MPVAGLVLTLDPTPDALQSAQEALSTDPRVTLGTPQGPCLPVATDTASVAEQDALWAWLQGAPGVSFVTLAWMDFSDVDDFVMPSRWDLPRSTEEPSHGSP
ncbi:MAG: hypothetical protein HY909_09815 [Deltaproteobacteria bacterium]|nr:hypothetical protein [Deltaproteobacteria bacterium]